MRPFWIHQAAEYLIGIALVAQGLQDPKPVVPCVVGTLVILNAAIVRGPLGAFKWFGRGLHRWLDVGMMGVIAVRRPAAVGRHRDRPVAAMMLVMLLPLGFLWFYTDWAERPARKERRKANAGPTGEKIGRSAGRLAGSGYVAAKAGDQEALGAGLTVGSGGVERAARRHAVQINQQRFERRRPALVVRRDPDASPIAAISRVRNSSHGNAESVDASPPRSPARAPPTAPRTPARRCRAAARARDRPCGATLVGQFGASQPADADHRVAGDERRQLVLAERRRCRPDARAARGSAPLRSSPRLGSRRSSAIAVPISASSVPRLAHRRGRDTAGSLYQLGRQAEHRPRVARAQRAHDDVVHVGRVLDDDHVVALRTAEAELGDRRRCRRSSRRALVRRGRPTRGRRPWRRSSGRCRARSGRRSRRAPRRRPGPARSSTASSAATRASTGASGAGGDDRAGRGRDRARSSTCLEVVAPRGRRGRRSLVAAAVAPQLACREAHRVGRARSTSSPAVRFDVGHGCGRRRTVTTTPRLPCT